MAFLQLRDDELLILRGPQSYDPEQLARVFEPLGFQAYISTRFAAVKHELKQLVLDKGVSYVWRLVRLREAVLPAGPEQRHGLIEMLGKMLVRLAPAREFLVVDPYLFPKKTPTTYLTELVSLLEPIARVVQKITLVTSKDYDAKLVSSLQAALAAESPDCQLVYKVSERYHDRFWIADSERGLFVGTSLNGIGRRYAMADYMEVSDVKHVVEDLKSQGIL